MNEENTYYKWFYDLTQFTVKKLKKKEANGLQVSKTIDLTNLTTYLQRVTLPDEEKRDT